jgi:hypothetical protein
MILLLATMCWHGMAWHGVAMATLTVHGFAEAGQR